MFDSLSGYIIGALGVLIAACGVLYSKVSTLKASEKAKDEAAEREFDRAQAEQARNRASAELARTTVYQATKEIQNEQEKIAAAIASVHAAGGMRSASEIAAAAAADSNRPL